MITRMLVVLVGLTAVLGGVDLKTPPKIEGIEWAMRETPAPSRDCNVYRYGVLHTVKKNGDTWYNDKNKCEFCKCVDGSKRCFYHFCNRKPTVVLRNPSLGLPPWDDEDRGSDAEGDWEEGEEGSGRPPPSPYKGYPKSPELRARTQANDTPPPEFCEGLCNKACPWGYELDQVLECRKCVCRRRCRSLDECTLQCLEGLATDKLGCPVCQCKAGKDTRLQQHEDCPKSAKGCVDGGVARAVGESWARGKCVKCVCVSDGYTECNVTSCNTEMLPQCPPFYDLSLSNHCCPPCQEAERDAVPEVSYGRAEVSVQSAWERDPTYPPARDPAPQSRGTTSDGAVKSAVQAEVLTWWQMVLIMVSVVAVCVVVVVVALKHYRRAHHDKYDINAYTMPHKVRHVATPDHVTGRLM